MSELEILLTNMQEATLEAIISKKQINMIIDYINKLLKENKQLKEELENDIDRYEDTISYQLGFDKGKEYLQQRIDKAIEYIKPYRVIDKNIGWLEFTLENKMELLEILEGKVIEEIPQFKGTLEELDNLTLGE